MKKVTTHKSQVTSECGRKPLVTPSASSGFTLVETLVAIAILMIAIAGPLTVAEKGLAASIYAKNQMMASYLAQDAMEAIKNQVDSNELNNANIGNSGTAWLADPAAPNSDLASCTASDPCTIDTVQNDGIQNCGGVSQCAADYLYLTSSGYSYSQVLNEGGTSNDTINFSRTLYLTTFGVNGGSTNGATVVVSVAWPGDVGGGGGTMLEDTLFDALQ